MRDIASKRRLYIPVSALSETHSCYTASTLCISITVPHTLSRMEILPAFRLRTTIATDKTFLEDLYMVLHRFEFAGLGLQQEQLDALLRMQARAQRTGYAADFPAAMDRLILKPDGSRDKPVGRILVDYQASNIQLIDIALLPEMQGHGIGTAILRIILAAAENACLPVRLSVRPGNIVRRLYERLGFVSVTPLRMEYVPSTCQRAGTATDADQPMETSPSSFNLNSSMMERLVGQRFSLRFENSADGPDLVLAHFHRSSLHVESFTLIFHGPLEPILPQSTYLVSLLSDDIVSHPEEQPIFLVPIGPNQKWMQYEAVFNC